MTAPRPAAPRLDEVTRRAVREAQQSGGTDDPRVDALARDAARRDLRRPWMMWGYVILAPLALVSAFADDSRGPEHWFLIAAHLLVAVLFGTSAWQLATTRRRANRYLRTPPAAAEESR